MTWIKVSERIPSVNAGKFKVRLDTDTEKDAYFYADKIGWIAFYGQKTSHWWDAKGDHKRLDNVTEWREKDER